MGEAQGASGDPVGGPPRLLRERLRGSFCVRVVDETTVDAPLPPLVDSMKGYSRDKLRVDGLAGLTVAALSKSKTKTIEQTRPGHELVSDRRRPELGGDQHEPLAVPQCLASLVLSRIARDAG